MTPADTRDDSVVALDAPSRDLVLLALVIATGSESEIRDAMVRATSATTDPQWVEELILQSYLFVGFPRTLNAAREWRRASGRPAPRADDDADPRNAPRWQERGERTCATVYGPMYERLRVNIRELHPALDAWMIVDGYGKVLGRPGLDLRRRELCIVGVCAALEQDRQLHAHLHGALNAGATQSEVADVLHLADAFIDEETSRRYRHLWSRVVGP